MEWVGAQPEDAPSAASGGASPATAEIVGRLERIDARIAWAHEERDFTPWLLEHADYLAEAIGFDLEFEAAEHRVGPFELDLLGRDVSNDAVLVVENQLAATDHGHLGQLLTYAAGTGAGTIIWIATAFSEQHRQAIDWLNQRTDEETHFFAVELELVQINGSIPAPHFKVVAAPNDWQKSARRITQSARTAGGKAALYTAFWPKLIRRLNADRPSWTRRDPNTARFSENWIDMPCPVPGAHFSLSFARGRRLRHEIYVGGGDVAANLGTFRDLERRSSELEASYGRALSFEELPGRSACRIADYAADCDVSDEDRHDDFIEWFVDSGDRFRRAFHAVGLSRR